MAPSAGLFLPLKSSTISAIVTHSTPSCLLICSIKRSCMSNTCGLPDTSGWTVIGKMNSEKREVSRAASETGMISTYHHTPCKSNRNGPASTSASDHGLTRKSTHPPQFLHIMSAHPAVRVRNGLHEHHRRQIVLSRCQLLQETWE